MPYKDEHVAYVYPSKPLDWKTSGVTYNSSRPGCAFDLKWFDYYVPKNNDDVESFFTRETITYNHEDDYYKWKHVEDLYNKENKTEEGNIPVNGPLFRNFNGYGFNYSTPLGVGNPENAWYTHTDLDLDIMIKIRDQIRGPIVQLIKEAKEYEDVYKACRSRQEFENRVKKYNDDLGDEGSAPSGSAGLEGYIPTDPEEENDLWSEVQEWPPITKSSGNEDGGLSTEYQGFTFDCEDYTCKGLEKLINAIPLECSLIREQLGAEWAGCDLNNYWWYGWLPKEWLEKINNDYGDTWPQAAPSPYGGGTGESPNTQTQGPPYQSIIGSFNCPEQEEKYSWIGGGQSDGGDEVLAGYTGDACGCISDPSDSLPDYMTKCQYPVMGERYPEYLEYVRSVDATYWNQPLKSRLYRKAQMALLFSQRMQIEVPGDLSLRIGDIIKVIHAPIAGEDGWDLQANLMGGKWLVTKINHRMGAGGKYTMLLHCSRDNTSISADAADPADDGIGYDFGGDVGGLGDITASVPNFDLPQ